jgi:hypothetical protein
VDGGLSILQYADDNIIFVEHDLNKAKNIKLILSAFEQLSGLKISFHKTDLLSCELGQFSIKLFRHPYSLSEACHFLMETRRRKITKAS